MAILQFIIVNNIVFFTLWTLLVLMSLCEMRIDQCEALEMELFVWQATESLYSQLRHHSGLFFIA